MPRKPGLVAASVLLLLVLAGYAPGLHPALELLANFRLQLVVLAGAFALVLGLLRHSRSAVLALVAAGAGAAGLGPVYDGLPEPGTGRPVSLLYANLYESNPVPVALLARLRAVDAEILITSETPRLVAEALAAIYPHRLVTWNPGRSRFTAIWSKDPLSDGTIYMNNTVAPTGAAATAELGDGLRLGLIGGHFSRPSERLHMIQAAALQRIAAPLGRPLVVAGDFNAEPWGRVVARAAAATGTRILGGYRITWRGDYKTPLGPVPAPVGHQIDQILVGPGIGVASVETVDLPGSDHRGVLVQLRIAPP